jgi:NADH:ubiquinone reductase (H+-translocating)
MKTPKLLILGGGFGGVYSYLAIRKLFQAVPLDIVLVSKSEQFVFTPMLTEYLTGDSSLAQVQRPLAKIIDPTRASLLITEVLSIDLAKRLVRTTAATLSYDYLLIALGSATNFYGISGAEQHSHVVRQPADVLAIGQQIAKNIALADRTTDSARRKALLTVALIGAGPTGVELAAKVSELAASHHQALDIQLIDVSDQILRTLPPKLRQKAANILERQGVTSKTGTAITKVSDGILHFSDGNSLAAGTCIWTAGIQPAVPDIPAAPRHPRTGQLLIDHQLRLSGHHNVFAVGDIARIDDDGEGEALPTVAQVAVQQSKTAAANLMKTIQAAAMEGTAIGDTDLQTFQYRSKGILVPLGRRNGVGQLAGHTISGPLVSLGCRLLYKWRFPV